MARYKNVTRTASVQWALKFWMNTVRNYDELVYDSDFFDIIAYNLERDEVAAVIGGNLDAKELKPLTEAKDERLELDRDCVGFMLKRIWNWKPLRKRCRAVLRILHDRLLRRLVSCEEDVRFERRFRRLCRFFRLDAVEADVLKFVYVLYSTAFDDFPQDISVADRPLYFAMALDRSFAEVTAALSRNGRLFRYNCIDEAYNFNFKELGGYFEGMEAVPLDARYYRLDAGEALPWDFYGKLAAEDGAVLREMLDARRDGGRLNILFYGVPGTGKTSFARTLAAVAGFKPYELLQGESDGRNVSAATRLAGIQIFNVRMAAGRTLLVVDEADELLRTNGSFMGERIRGGSEKGVINTVLDGMKTPAIWISNADSDEMDESVRRRFDYSIRFRALTRCQRETIWRNNIRKLGMKSLITEAAAATFAERYETSAGGITMVLENVKRLHADPSRAEDLVERIMRPHCESRATWGSTTSSTACGTSSASPRGRTRRRRRTVRA